MRVTIWTALLVAMAFGCIGSSPVEPGSRPTIVQLQPSTAAVGDAMTITGSRFTSSTNAVKIGAGYLYNLSSADSTTLHFDLPDYLGVCPPDQQVCVALALPLPPGDYKVSVVNANGTSNQVSLHVIAK